MAGESESRMIDIVRATLADAEAILALQKQAYQSEAALYGDPSIPPLVQTIEEMREDLRTQVVVKAMDGERVVGSARAYERDGTTFIGRVIVSPALQGQGLGKRIMAAIEAEFPNARRFELFTGHLSTRNLRFYRTLGYQEYKTVAVSGTLSFVYLEKHVSLR
jgi:ribosomal protein S18 acetylase RimI-like enzyme